MFVEETNLKQRRLWRFFKIKSITLLTYIWSCWRNEIGAVVSPMSLRSTSKAGSSYQLGSGQKGGLTKLKELTKMTKWQNVSAVTWIRNRKTRNMIIRLVMSRTRPSPRFLSFRFRGLLRRFLGFRNTPFILRSIGQVFRHETVAQPHSDRSPSLIDFWLSDKNFLPSSSSSSFFASSNLFHGFVKFKLLLVSNFHPLDGIVLFNLFYTRIVRSPLRSFNFGSTRSKIDSWDFARRSTSSSLFATENERWISKIEMKDLL